MKKINSKRSFMTLMLFFSISLILTNCNKEDQTIVDESQLEKTTPLISNQKIPFNQAQHFNQLDNKINKIKDKINGHNSQSKTDNEDIIILTDVVLYITYASTHTYSFKILREQPQAFIENIVLHYNIETEDYDEYLVQYHISSEQFVSIHEGDLLQSSENVTITSLENGFFENNSQAKSCNRVCVTVTTTCGGSDHHDFGDISCPLIGTDEEASSYQSCSSVCDNDNEITAPDGNSGGGSTGGGNTTVVSNPLPTEPCESDISSDGVGITGSNGECLVVEEIIVTPELEVDYPCQSEIIKNTFKKTAPLSQLILDIFDSDSSGYNLVFDVNEALEGTRFQGITSNTSENSEWNLDKLDITIGLNPDLLNNGTDLAIATTVVHESVHAVLLYMLETGKLTLENTNGDRSMTKIVDSYIMFRIIEEEFGGIHPPDVSAIDNYVHQYMTELIENIATSLSEYGNSKGYNIAFSYYKKLAWLGLKANLEMIMFDDEDIDEDEQAELDDIQETLLNEFENRPNAKGTKCSNQ